MNYVDWGQPGSDGAPGDAGVSGAAGTPGATEGGGVYIASGESSFINTVLVGNISENGSGLGAGQGASAPQFDNSVLWDNRDSGDSDLSAEVTSVQPAAFHFSCVEDALGSVQGNR